MLPLRMEIGGFDLASRVFIVAELSANHGGSLEVARETLKAMKRAGADAVELQSFTADTITIDSDHPDFQIDHGTLWDGTTLYKLYQEAAMPWEWHSELFELASELGLICFSSPFDNTAVDLLEDLKAPAYKIASFEIRDIPLIRYAASKMKPMIMSTGIAREEDIFNAVNACREMGNDQIILLKCTSAYPARVDEANLRTMSDYSDRFHVEIGLSDHTTGSLVPTVATSLGARFIEKHFILNKDMDTPDKAFSMDESEFGEMVNAVREAELALGKVSYELVQNAEKNRKFGRSIYTAESLKKGDVLTTDNIRSIRPGFGLPPEYLPWLYGKVVNQDIEFGTPFSLEFLDEQISL